jgi:hypothetical protein
MSFQGDNATQCSFDYSGDGKNVTRILHGWSVKGYEISYKFTNVTVGFHEFAINCTVNSSAPLNEYIKNDVTLNWIENNGILHNSNATIYVPPIRFGIDSNRTQVEPNLTIQWRIYFENYIGSNIPVVWINETLPFDMVYNSDNSSECSIKYSGDSKNITKFFTGWTSNGFEINFEFTNVTPGSHYFVINCTINSSISSWQLINNATLECSNLAETIFDFNSVSVIPEYKQLLIPILIIIVLNIILIPQRIRMRRKSTS